MKVKRIFAACTAHGNGNACQAIEPNGVRLVFALQIRGKDDHKSRLQSSQSNDIYNRCTA